MLSPRVPTATPRPGVAVLSPSGEQDMPSRPELEEAVLPLRPETCSVVIDLSQVESLDSTIVNELFHAHRALVAGGDRLVVRVTPRHPVRRVLEIIAFASEVIMVPARERTAALPASAPAAATRAWTPLPHGTSCVRETRESTHPPDHLPRR